MTLFDNPSAWTAVGAVVVQAILTWARVGELTKRVEALEKCIAESKEWRAANGQRIADIAADIAELRRKVFNGSAKP